MIIACPACSTRYAVADSSIGVDGRVVRCAKCRHSWFQDPPEVAEPGIETAAQPALPEANPAPRPEAAVSPEGDGAPALPIAALSSPVETAPSPIRDPADTYADPPWARDFAETPSSFAYEPPFLPRRNRLRGLLIAAILLVLVALAAIGAAAEFGIPDWLSLPRGAFAGAEPDLVLDFPKGQQERRRLPNGSDFFNVGGSIRNTGRALRAVPNLRIVLLDGHNNIVYSLETAPPKSALAPGESETIDQAIIDAPSSARSAEIGWKPG